MVSGTAGMYPVVMLSSVTTSSRIAEQGISEKWLLQSLQATVDVD